MSVPSGARILVVDDQPYVCEILSQWLTDDGHQCVTASSGDEAWKALQEGDFSLLISDIMMPGMSGMELLSKVTGHLENVAVIMVTAIDDRKTAIHALELGAYGYVIKPFQKNEVLISVANALERRNLTMASKEYERHLEETVRERTEEIRQTQEEITLHLAAAAEFRDEATGAHIRRIGLYAATIAEALGEDLRFIHDMHLAAPMHDIGKIGIPDALLLKEGKLSRREFAVLKTHTTIGTKILGNLKVPLLQMAAQIALSHHEHWDGAGYPEGLTGEDIPLPARIVALADVYDALITDRPYRVAMSEEEAVTLMKGGRGKHFDPELFDVFWRERWQLQRIRQEVKDVLA